LLIVQATPKWLAAAAALVNSLVNAPGNAVSSWTAAQGRASRLK
jgi:hypothetical protein